MDLPVWVPKTRVQKSPACERPHSSQLDPLSFIESFFPSYSFLIHTWKVYFYEIILKTNKKTPTWFLNSDLINFYKFTFSCKKLCDETFSDSCTSLREPQKLMLSNLGFCSCQEKSKKESNWVSRVSLTEFFCSLLNEAELPLLGGKYSSVSIAHSEAYLFWQLYGTSCAAIHIARVQSRRRARGILLHDRLLFQLIWNLL